MNFKSLILAGLSLVSTVSFSQDFNYGEALQKSILFYEAQQSGEMPDWNRVSWKGDSALIDGDDVGEDLKGGWYDAGDHVKFGFPMAYSATVLAWGAIEYKEAYENSGQMVHLKNNLRFVCDFFIKAHTGPNEFYGQVGNGSDDHAWWGAAEVMQMDRPAYKIDAANPGSDLAGETAAALAAASMVFADSDPAYSATLLEHAEQLYDFADNYRGAYSDSITDAVAFYNSWSGYQDEIVWGAAWLYRATNDSSYLDKAKVEYENLGYEGQSKEYRAYKWGLAWDDKSYGCYVLMSILTGEDQYKADAERHLDFWSIGFEGETIPYSPGGQAHLTTWGSLRHTANTSFLAFIYSDNVETSKADVYHDFAVSQINYTLGDNPNNRSYMMGFGVNPPLNAHHRSAHGTWQNNLSGEPENNRHILYGALVGGPSAPDDSYVDDRTDYIANEVACDYNACYTGALARMYHEYGGTPLSSIPQEVPTDEFLASAKFNSNNDSGITVSVMAQNHSAWPAVETKNLSFKYFFDITEGAEAGYTIDDYNVSLSYAEGNGEMTVGVWDAESNIYYAEVSFPNDGVFPGGNSESRREAQVNIQVGAGVPWDISNDYSAVGLEGIDRINSDNIPVYDNGVLLSGSEPSGGDTPKAYFTATPVTGFAPLVVEFDSSDSSDPNGDNITYAWVFGNGETSIEANPTITFTEIGSFEVSLTVSDGANTSSAYTATITVEDSNIAPVAIIKASATTGIAPFAIDFNASDSYDENDDSLTYAWDFGEGSTSNLISASNTFTAEGEYEVSLTVSDGAKTDTEKITITITDGSPVISYTYSIEEGDSPFEVSFDASSSEDPEGGNLTYAWDFGNGSNGSEAVTSATYSDDGEYTVMLTITNESGKEATETFTIKVGSSVCKFNTPFSSALPTMTGDFQNVFIIGEDAPEDLQGIEKASVNWNLENNGGSLYNFSVNLKQGYDPNYINISAVSNNSFNSSNPAISISGSGMSGLDGDYYVAEDNGNFVMVSENGDYAIYFSKSTTEPSCPDIVLSNPILDVANYEINVFPNPATELLNVVVKTTEDLKDVEREVVVVNLLGQTVVSKTIENGETLVDLDVNNVTAGVYLVQINVDGQQLKVEKLIVN